MFSLIFMISDGVFVRFSSRQFSETLIQNQSKSNLLHVCLLLKFFDSTIFFCSFFHFVHICGSCEINCECRHSTILIVSGDMFLLTRRMNLQFMFECSSRMNGELRALGQKLDLSLVSCDVDVVAAGKRPNIELDKEHYRTDGHCKWWKKGGYHLNFFHTKHRVG
uniref:Uncharacterized protein n=1 Tax=Helianthus annuus TaxID=4232 RepID=A0A251VIE0_HELAN